MSFVTRHNVFALPQRPLPLRRPACLIRAARAGQAGWQRDRDLPRLLGRETLPTGPAALNLLRGMEQAADDARREGRADYDIRRHVLLAIALLAEMRLAEGEATPVQDGAQLLAFTGRGTARPAPRA
ncbi:DUF6477 family protein [Paracoccus jeotgali]|uniref:DUF6477 family protein n=1 Tax=Paracoccus jeotgali TaxID=2065379 RepID=UPI0028AF76B5|nr:DUF6477 family protein [Paracoccus jeotgali]